MKTLITLTSFLLCLSAQAETATLSIEGMHCGGCKKIVTKKICENAELATSFESCEISALDTKKQIGTLTVSLKKGSKLDTDKIEKLLSEAGDYKITKPATAATKK